MRQVQSAVEVHRDKIGAAMLLILTLVSPSLYAKPKLFEIIENGLTGILNAQLRKITDGVDLAKDQLDIEKKIYNLTEDSMRELNRNITGSYSVSGLMNDAKEQAKRRWSPGDIFKDNGNAEYQKLGQEHDRKYDFDREHGFITENKITKTALQEHKQTQKAAIVSAQYTNQKMEENITNIESLMTQIDKTENQKAATDLNSRIQSQVALELVELKRLSALQLQTMGTLSQHELLGQQANAQFNRWEL